LRTKLAIDTSVWIESLCPSFAFYEKARALVDAVDKGHVFALVTPLTATEVFYISYRVYQELGLSGRDALKKSGELFDYMLSHPYILVHTDTSVMREAALVKIKYGIALSDSYLLALSHTQKALPVFCKVEKEMKEVLKSLRQEFNVGFLSKDWDELSKLIQR